MRNNVKGLILICAFLLWGMQSIESYAAMIDNEADQYVEEYIAEYDESVKIMNKEKLYNEEGKEIAVLYQLFPEGYIVIEPDNCTIIEYSWSVDYPFFKGETNYYN